MQVNSAVLTKSFTWDFGIEGNPGAGGVSLGVSLQPGEIVVAAYYKIITPITTSGNPATDTMTFTIIPFNIAGYRLLTDTINALNTSTQNWIQCPYPAGVTCWQNGQPIGSVGIFNATAYSTAAITAGKVVIGMHIMQHQI